jgi:hypothetical protein
MIIVSNGYTSKRFYSLQAMLDFFGVDVYNSIMNKTHSQYSMMYV